MNKKKLFSLLLPALAVLSAGCTSVNFTGNLTGMSGNAILLNKNFSVIGPISVDRIETHRAAPCGFVKKVEGSKVTYTDLIMEAAELGADDIIDVRIDVNNSGKTSFADWLTGWKRTFTYTGTALAIVYIDMTEAPDAEEDTEEETFEFYRR